MVFVVSGGELSATDRAPAAAPYAVRVAEGVQQDYATIVRTQPQVRTVVSFLARNIAQLGLHCYRRVSDVDRQRVTDHPLPVLLGRPNPFTTRYRMIDSLVSDLAIYDQGFLVKIAPEGGRRALLRVDPRKVSPLGDNPFEVDGWRVRGRQGHRDLPADQVVHFRGHNPSDARLGASPIETLRRILTEEFEAGRYREQLWRNAARTSGYLRRPSDAPKWSPDGRARFRAQWQAQYLGDGPQAGGTPILEDGMSFEPSAMTPEAAQYIEARKLTREEVTAAYHIPLPMVGILEHATYCLPVETLVSTERGPVRIGDVVAGDRVWSVVDGALRTMPVTWSGQTGFKPLLTIRTQNRTLRCTSNHPVLTRRRVRTDTSAHTNRRRYRWEHVWLSASELTLGDVVVTVAELPEHGGDVSPTGRTPMEPPTGCGHARVVSITTSNVAVPVYDLTVEGSHNFAAEGVVVHNSNIREQHKQLYADTLGPWLVMLVEDLELQLLDDFDDTGGLYLEFNIAEKLSGNFEEQAGQLQTSVGAPWMTRNEARARMNLPQIDGGDDLVTPLNVVTGGQASPTDSAPPPDPAATSAIRGRVKRRCALFKARPDGFDDRAGTVFAGFFARQGRAVASALGAAKAAGRKADVAEVFDADRWSGELAADLFGLDVAIATAAGRSAMEELGEEPDVYDEARTDEWHLAAAAGIATAVTLVTAARLADALDDDDPLAAVGNLFAGFVTVRAVQLAVSHVTAMAGFGSTEAARQLNRPATKTWRTRSSNPRPEHARMNGETVAVDDVFSNRARWPGDSVLDEDERANCVPAGTLVTARGVQASWRRWYEGEMVHLALSSGRMLAATPNHPVLTQRGWVAAGMIDESDQLVDSLAVQGLMARQPHVHHEPAAIDEVHRTLSNVLAPRRMPGLAVDFHGDGRDGDVDVVWTARRLLGNGVIKLLPQKVRDALFLATNPWTAGCCCGARPSCSLIVAGNSSTSGDVGGRSDCLTVARVGLGVPECCCLGERSDRYAGIKEPLAYCAAVDTEHCGDGVLRHAPFVANSDLAHIERQSALVASAAARSAMYPDLDQALTDCQSVDAQGGADLLESLAALVASDDVVDVERHAYAGHVFNLSTTGGWYSANGLIVHNCHCDLEIAVSEPEGVS